MRRQFFIFTACLGFALQVSAQDFDAEVAAFANLDNQLSNKKGGNLFVGSSSFTLWKQVEEYFPGKHIVNRAFGGSTLANQWYYRHLVYDPHQPKVIVMYCGENDIANNENLPIDSVVMRFKNLFGYIRQKNPRVKLVYVSMKPSPLRKSFMEKYSQANLAIAQFLKAQRRTRFVDAYTAMLNSQGQPNGNLFGPDQLHMNAAGYQLWQRLLKKHLR